MIDHGVEVCIAAPSHPALKLIASNDYHCVWVQARNSRLSWWGRTDWEHKQEVVSDLAPILDLVFEIDDLELVEVLASARLLLVDDVVIVSDDTIDKPGVPSMLRAADYLDFQFESVEAFVAKFDLGQFT